MNIIIVEIRIMFFTPMFGIKMNPAVKVPTILPNECRLLYWRENSR